MKLGQLYVELSAKGIVPLNAALKEVEKRVQKNNQVFQNLGKVITGLSVAITAFATKAVYDFTKYTSEIDRLTKVTGTSAEAIQGLGYAAEQEHASMMDLANGLKFLARTMGDARDGLAEAKRAFDKLGESIYDEQDNLRNVTDLLLVAAEKFKGMTNETEKTSLAMELFGRAGVNLVPFLSMGRAEIEKLTKEAKDLGLVLKDDVIKQGKALEDQFVKLKGALKGVALDLGTALLPVLKEILNNIIPLIKTFASLPDDLKRTTVELAAFVAGLWALNKVLNTLKVSLAATNLINFILTLGTALGMAAAEVYNNIQKSKEAKEAWAEFYADLEYGIPVIEVTAKAIKKVSDATKEATEAIKTEIDVITEYLALIERERQGIEILNSAYENAYNFFANKWLPKLREIKEEIKEEGQEIDKLALIFQQSFAGVIVSSIDSFSTAFVDMIWGVYGSFSEWVSAMIKEIVRLMVKMAALAALKSIIGSLTGGIGGWLGKALGLFEEPTSDMWARRQGYDFARQFQESFSNSFKSPTQVPSPINVIIHNANPNTYVEILSNLTLSQKQRLYERGILPGQKRYDKR